MLASKLLRIKYRVKHRIDNYVKENKDEISFDLIFKFLVNHYCISGASLEDFMNNNRPKKRIIIVWTYYILLWIISLTRKHPQLVIADFHTILRKQSLKCPHTWSICFTSQHSK
jgi:hypothetical protein